MNPEFPKIFSPFTIKNLTLRNRICSTAHYAEWMSDDAGLPNADFVAYMRERARGGIGLLTVGATTVTPDGGPVYFQNVDDRFIEGYQRVADAVHKDGAKLIAQLIHIGDQAPVVVGRPAARIQLGEFLPPPPAAESTPPSLESPSMRDWSVKELSEIAGAFGEGAYRAKAGGVDGVELHAHERYLHAQFLSPIYNKRNDDYGGSLENRARLVIDTLSAMRQAVGDDFVVGVRLKARDFHPEGMVEEDYVRLIRMLTARRLIDYVSLTAGTDFIHHGPMYLPDGELLPIVAAVRSKIDVPVIHAGRITDARLAEEALASGQVDLVGMTKTHIADPHFVRKLREGRPEDIRHCIRCLDCLEIEAVTCIYNPVTRRENDWSELRVTRAPKRVVIVGAGPAGMEAALTSAARGHDVVVLEKSQKVGGQTRLAGAGPLRGKFAEIANFYERQAAKGSFELRVGVDATPQSVLGERPDVVLVATGSRPRKPALHGIDADRLFAANDVLLGQVDAAATVLVIDRDGRAPAFVAADYLTVKDIRVEFVAAMDRVARNLGDRDGALLVQRLSDRGVSFRAGFDIARVQDHQVVLREVSTGSEMLIGTFDAVVLAAGDEPVNDLAELLTQEFDEVHVIGAANRSRSIREATVDGATIGRSI